MEKSKLTAAKGGGGVILMDRCTRDGHDEAEKRRKGNVGKARKIGWCPDNGEEGRIQKAAGAYIRVQNKMLRSLNQFSLVYF